MRTSHLSAAAGQARSDGARPEEVRLDQIRLGHAGPGQIRLDQIRQGQARGRQTGPDQAGPDQRSDWTRQGQARGGPTSPGEGQVRSVETSGGHLFHLRLDLHLKIMPDCCSQILSRCGGKGTGLEQTSESSGILQKVRSNSVRDKRLIDHRPNITAEVLVSLTVHLLAWKDHRGLQNTSTKHKC